MQCLRTNAGPALGTIARGAHDRLVAPKEVRELCGGQGAAEQVALPELTAQTGKEASLRFGLDTLGNDLQAQRTTHRDDRLDQCHILGIIRNASDKRLVDFQGIDGEALQIT